MKKKAYLTLFLALAIIASGCSNQDNGSVATDGSISADTETNAVSEDNISESSTLTNTSEIFSDRDYEVGYDERESAVIQLNGHSATCSSDTVQISGSTITITEEGTYILSGTLDDGMLIVNTDKSDKVQLVLDNVTIYSETCAPIYIPQSDKVFITMAANSTNTLSNGGMFTAIDDNNIDAVIFSKEDVTLNGSGTLIITSPAGHGIVSKDSLKITSGSYDINCASHAISGKDDVCITNADITITAGKDGIHVENADDTSLGYVYIQSGTFSISAESDGITASSYLQIEDGSFDITTGGGSVNASSHNSDSRNGFPNDGRHGGSKRNEAVPDMPDGPNKRNEAPPDMAGGPNERVENPSSIVNNSSDNTSMKAVKASASLVINGGNFSINSADDSFHSNGSATINDGTFIIASGDDAFHVDETLTVTGGTINITESYEGLEGLHVDISGGDITLTARDDGVNAAGGTDSSGNTGGRDGMFGPESSSSSNGNISISGGNLKITASGDGIDANGTLTITGGHITVSGPTQGDTAILDYDVSGTISGGTFIGTGAANRMTQTFSESEQGIISVNVGSRSAGTQIQLSDSDGNTLITYTPELDFVLVIFSSPDIVSGETYTLTIDDSSKEFTAS